MAQDDADLNQEDRLNRQQDIDSERDMQEEDTST